MPPENHIVDLGPEDVRPITPAEPTPSPEKEEATTQSSARTSSPAETGAARATFLGNAYDLAAFGALGSGLLALVSCVTCNTIYYCLPLLPIALGAVGLVAAEQSVDARRTRAWSWIGVAAGVIIMLVALAAIALYVAFVALMFYMSYMGKLD